MNSFLVVDDDEAFRERLVRSLLAREQQAESAASGKEALKKVQERSFTHAILDLRMPDLNGLEVLKVLRTQHPSMKILLLTGFGSISTAMEAVRLGAHHYLTKPVRIEEILSVFQKEEIVYTSPTKFTEKVPSLAQVEWEYLQRVLNECEGNITKAAQLLGMHRRSLQRKLSKPPIAL